MLTPAAVESIPALLLIISLLMRLSAAGQTPDSFNPGADSNVTAIAVQPDGKIIVGGRFNSIGGQLCPYLARLNPEGTFDDSFSSLGADAWVRAVVIQPDGRIIVGGEFGSLEGQWSPYIGRLNSDGTIDTNFNAVLDGRVDCLLLQADGSILIGGNFTSLNGQQSIYFGKLNSDGSPAANFASAITNTALSYDSVDCLAEQPDGKILAGGGFSLNSAAFNNLIRVEADGSLDGSFQAHALAFFNALAVQPDGKIIAGGSMLTRYNSDGTPDSSFSTGIHYSGVDSVALQADGKIIIGSTQNLTRLLTNGTPDGSFSLVLSSARDQIYSAVVCGDGNVLVGGNFTTIAGQPRNFIARLTNTEPASDSLSLNGSGVLWLRGGTAPEFSRTEFDLSTNSTDWSDLGSGARVSGGWQLSTTAVSVNGTLRARGFIEAPSTSGWFIEELVPITVPLRIITDDGKLGFMAGHFGFNITGGPNEAIVVEASSNLVNWIPLSTNVLGTSPMYFSDPSTAYSPERSYRLHLAH
jgi:uncharacterized delta-60 repeat protein